MKREKINYKKVEKTIGVHRDIIRSLCVSQSKSKKEHILEYIVTSVARRGEKLFKEKFTKSQIKKMDKDVELDWVQYLGSQAFMKDYYTEKNKNVAVTKKKLRK